METTQRTNVKPLLRWVGGKQKLTKKIVSMLKPVVSANPGSTYHEPFVGGGSVFFSLAPKNAQLNDMNSELMNFYNETKRDWRAVHNTFKSFPFDEGFYYALRAKDRDVEEWAKADPTYRAARFLYLNKSCFQGLWRVSAKTGCNNVPWGRRNPKLADVHAPSMETVSQALKDVELTNVDFEKALSACKTGDVVYLDPPYVRPETSTGSFTAYTSERFNEDDHKRIVTVCKSLDKNGVKFLLSNSDCKATRKMYRAFNTESVDVRRSVSAKSSSRVLAPELLVRNF